MYPIIPVDTLSCAAQVVLAIMTFVTMCLSYLLTARG